MKKVQTKNKTKGLFGIFATLALAIGVGVSLNPREVVKTSAATVTTKVTLPDNGTDATVAFSNSTIYTGLTGANSSKGLKDATNSEFITSTVATSSVFAGVTGFKFGSSNNRGSWKFKTQETVTRVEAVFKGYSGDTSQGKITSHESPLKSITSGNLPTSETTLVLADTSSNEFSIDVSGKRGYLISLEFTYEVEETREVRELSFSGTPATQYIGEPFDPSGLTFSAEYDDESIEVVPHNLLTFFPATITAETVEITVSLNDFESDQKIEGFDVVPLVLLNIEVTTEPSKKEYYEGDEFDITGMVVTATYNSGKTENVTSEVTISPSVMALGTTSVTLTYGDKTATISGITVIKEPLDYVVEFGSNGDGDQWTQNYQAQGSDYIGFASTEHYVQTPASTILGGSQFVFDSDITFKFKVGTYGGSVSNSPTLKVDLIGTDGVVGTGSGKAALSAAAESYAQGPTIVISKPANPRLVTSVKISVSDKGSLTTSIYMRFQEVTVSFVRTNNSHNDVVAFTAWIMDDARNGESCGEKFLVAESKWDELSAEAKALFLGDAEFQAAEDRLLQWALANGLSSLADLDASGVEVRNPYVKSNNAFLLTITILVGVIALTTLTGIYFIKKRQTQR